MDQQRDVSSARKRLIEMQAIKAQQLREEAQQLLEAAQAGVTDTVGNSNGTMRYK